MNMLFAKIKRSSLLKSGFWYTVANFFLKGVNFLSIPIFVQMMSVKEYGIINNFTAWTLIVTYLIGLNLNSAISNANFKFKENMQKFMSSVLFLSILVGIVFILVFVMISIFWPHIFGFTTIIVFCILIQSFSTFSISFQSAYYMINNEYSKNILLSLFSTVSNFGVSLVFMVSIFKSHPDLGRIYGSTFGLGVLSFLVCILVLCRGRTFINFGYWKYALKLSVPVIPHSLGSILLSQFDRIMISKYCGDASAGVYSFAYNISTVINVLWISMNNAWIPWFYSRMEAARYAMIRRVMGKFTLLFSLLTVFSINVLIDVGRVMGSAAYQNGLSMIIPISLGYYFIFLYGFAVNTEFYFEKTAFIGAITATSATMNILLNLYCIPTFGYIAGAYTTLVTFIFQFICHLLMGRRLELKISRTIYSYKVFRISIALMCAYAILLMLFIGSIFIRYMLMILFAFLMVVYLIVLIRRDDEV